MKAGWRVVFTPQARRDAKKLARAGLRPRAETLLALLARDPFEAPPRFERKKITPSSENDHAGIRSSEPLWVSRCRFEPSELTR